MKKYFLLLLLFMLFQFVFGQNNIKARFLPDSIIIDKKVQKIDTLKTQFKLNTKGRVIIWENQLNKVSVYYKTTSSKRRTKTKARTEIFNDGEWQKAKLKITFYEVWWARPKFSRWTNKSRFITNNFIISSASGYPINETFIDSDNKTVKIIGYFEYHN